MHFSYIKSKILCRWLNILHNYFHSRTFFTPKIHPPPTTTPCPPPHLALHPNRPATPPYPPPHPAGPLSPGHDGVAIVATRWCRPRRSAKAVCVGWRSTNNLRTLSNKLHTLSNFLHTLSNILRTLSNKLHTLSNILHTLSNILRTYLIFYVPYLIFYVPYLRFYIPYPIFYVMLTCDAATVDTQSARPLPPGVVNCPCVTLAFQCPVELDASQVSVHSSAPEM